MSSVRIKVGFNSGELMDALCDVVDVEYLNDESKPTSPSKASFISSEILENIGKTLVEMSKDQELCIAFAKKSNMQKYFNKDKFTEEMESALEKEKIPPFLKDILRTLIRESIKGKKDE